ncbi:MAG: TetR/AcrR family transcriptional regulator [Kiritimatiellia bacterium]
MDDEKTTTEKAMTRREREREQHRQDILDAAEAIFTERGIIGVTIEDIAKKAEFSVGSIYNFFTGKDELIRQLFQRVALNRNAQVEEIMASLADRPIEALRVLTQSWISHHRLHGSFLRAAFVFEVSKGWKPGTPMFDPDMIEIFKRYDALGCDFFRKLADSGLVHNLPPRHLLMIFEGACRSYVMHMERTRDERPAEALAEELFGIVRAALTGRLA